MEQFVYGAILLDQRKSMEEIVGKDVVAQAIQGLPAEIRQEYESLLPVSWCPLPVAHKVIDAVAKAGNRPDVLEFHKDLVRRGIDRTMKGFWRSLLSLTSDNFMVSKAPLFFSKSYKRGSLQARFMENGKFEVILMDWPDVPTRDLEVIGVALQRVLELTGRKEVFVLPARTRDGAIYKGSLKAK